MTQARKPRASGPQPAGKGLALSGGIVCGLTRALTVRLRRPARTLFGREVFFPTHMSPGKTDFILIRACGRELCEAFSTGTGPEAKGFRACVTEGEGGAHAGV